MGARRILDFLLTVRSLMTVGRFSVYKAHLREDVAQHSYFTALYAMILGDLERARGRSVDVERLLRMAILHDAEESRTGDIHHPFKHEDRGFSEAIDERAIKWFSRLMEGLPGQLRSEYVKLREASRDYSIPEAVILRAADKLEALLWAYEERMLGNEHIKREGIVEDILAKLRGIELTSVKELAEELEFRIR